MNDHMIDNIIVDIAKNVTEALNKSLVPLIEKIKTSEEKISVLNKIVIESVIYQNLEKNFHELKFKYNDLIDENKRLQKLIDSTKNIDICIKSKNTKTSI